MQPYACYKEALFPHGMRDGQLPHAHASLRCCQALCSHGIRDGQLSLQRASQSGQTVKARGVNGVALQRLKERCANLLKLCY